MLSLHVSFVERDAFGLIANFFADLDNFFRTIARL